MPNTFTDNFGNEYMNPFIPQKVVGFTGIDPDIVSSGSGCTCSPDLSEEQRTQVNQMLVDYITNLTIKIDSGDVTDPIPPMPYVVLRPDEIPHNELNGLQGGQSGEYYHLTEEELQRLQALIAATFPSGSGPVFPSGPSGPSDPSGPDDPSGGDDDPDLDPFGGLPSTMSLDWSKLPLGKYTAYEDAGRMYYGNMITSSKPYTKTSLIVPLTQTGKNYTYLCSYTTGLAFDKEEKQSTIGTFGKTWADYVYVDWGDTEKAKYFYGMPPGCTAKTKDIISKHSGGSWGDPGTNKVTAGFIACCYSPPDGMDRVLLVTSSGEVTWIYDSNAKATTFTQKLNNASVSCGLSKVNMACAQWSTDAQLFCVTGPDGVATSETGDAWTVHDNVPKDLHDLEYRTDIEGITGGAFIAWSGVDRQFYVSRNGSDWTRYSSKAIPMNDVAQVAYAPEYGWYCAVGASGNKVYFSKTLTNWVATTIGASNDTPAQSVIWMPSTKKFVLMPKSGAALYTYEVTN